MVKVKVEQGWLEGELVEDEVGGKFCSFKGIPYAEPPIGDLRFKAPKPSKAWSGVRNAKEFGPVCHQHDMFVSNSVTGAEDCLYLNVYTPHINPIRSLPVMVWIHGGGFMTGSGNDNIYGPEFLVRHDVILVTLNYRLEVVGFLCLDTEDVPGNAGMKDQVAALRWVKKNISSFGGDPDNITIFGESAGGCSVSFHLLSPMSKGLFKRAIMQSGSSSCWWAKAFEPRERARILAKRMGFSSNDDKELYEFFKAQPIENLIMKKVPLSFTEENKEGIILYFSVVDEKQFGDNERFYHEGLVDIHEGVEVMTGYTKDEGLLLLSFQFNIERALDQINFNPEYLVPTEVSFKRPFAENMAIANKVMEFYFNDKLITRDNIQDLIKYSNMDIFVYGILSWAKNYAATRKNKIYLYKFLCSSERNVMKSMFNPSKVIVDEAAVSHADDLAYIFPMRDLIGKVDQKSKSFSMINNVTELWTNFVKFGNPTPDSNLKVKWSPYTIENQEYLEIGENLVTSTGPEKEEFEFWESILQDEK